MNPNPLQSHSKKKTFENMFHIISSKNNEEEKEAKKDKGMEETKEAEVDPILIEVGQEENYVQTLPKKAYIEVKLEASLSLGGSVTRSRLKVHLEETYERKEEVEA